MTDKTISELVNRERIERALAEAARIAMTGTREQRSGRFLPDGGAHVALDESGDAKVDVVPSAGTAKN